MQLLLLACVLLGCTDAATGQSPDSSGHRRIRREDVGVEDIVRAAAAEFETHARDVANATAIRLEERLAELEERLTDHSSLLNEALMSLAKLSESLLARDGQRVASAPASRPDGTAVGPQPSNRPSPTVGRVLGEPCLRNSDCSDLLTNTKCSKRGRCVCAADLLRGPGETCWPAPRLDGECRVNRQCHVGTQHAVCSSERICQCPSLMMTAADKCRPFPRLSEWCRTDADCRKATKHAQCSPVSRRCVCPRRFWNRGNVECRPGVPGGRRCLYDRDCSTVQRDTTCMDGVCKVRECERVDASKFTSRFRLVGGTSCSNGYVEFTYDAGKNWKFVCDSNWTKADATVFCGYMDFDWGEPKLVKSGSSKNVTRFLWTEDLECDGTEPNLTLCVWNEGRTSCAVSEVAKVECFLNPVVPATTELSLTEDDAAPDASTVDSILLT